MNCGSADGAIAEMAGAAWDALASVAAGLGDGFEGAERQALAAIASTTIAAIERLPITLQSSWLRGPARTGNSTMEGRNTT